MHGYRKRHLASEIAHKLAINPIVAILGPRQCGKTTLAKEIVGQHHDALFLDLEKESDRERLREPGMFFRQNRHRLVCLDEIQRVPDLFRVLRSEVDETGTNGQYLVLGSASRDLIRQGSESLAGRIAYTELTPFMLGEVPDTLVRLWTKGGFPRSYLREDDRDSYDWRLDFIQTFLERDLAQLGFEIPTPLVSRLWRLCAHAHGQVLNSSRLGEGLGITHHTVRKYVDILTGTFMVRLLEPFGGNLKKRLVKSPKLYIRDSGILHALLGIGGFNDLLAHPALGPSWEGFVIEQIMQAAPGWQACYYRSSNGAEIDLVLMKGARVVAIECKASVKPIVSRGFYIALEDVAATERYVIAPVEQSYPYDTSIEVLPLPACIDRLRE